MRLIFEIINKNHTKKLISVIKHSEIYKFVDEDKIDKISKLKDTNNFFSKRVPT